jgi:hypothetical protein
MEPLAIGQAVFLGGVHRGIHDLCELVLTECATRGYVFRLNPQQNWGYAGRFTKRSDGTQTTTPSNHSWGLAIDINSAVNVYGGDHNDFPDWMPPFLKSYGFRWLGPPIKDQQHFDFCGEPEDAVAMTAKARKELGGDDLSDYADGQLDFLDHPDRPLPLPDGWSQDKKNGYKVARHLAALPVPSGGGTTPPVDAHTHNLIGGKTGPAVK